MLFYNYDDNISDKHMISLHTVWIQMWTHDYIKPIPKTVLKTNGFSNIRKWLLHNNIWQWYILASGKE